MTNKTDNPITILGIDPGSYITGYGVIDRTKLLDWGIIKPPKSKLPKRIYIVCSQVEKLIEIYKPNIIAIENQFVGSVPYACMPINQIKGAVTFIAYKNNIEFVDYCPTKCKKELTGNGRASKDQIIKTISSMFKINTNDLEHNCADAISIAYCCLKNNYGDFI